MKCTAMLDEGVQDVFEWGLFSDLMAGKVMRGVLMSLFSCEKTQRSLSCEVGTHRSSVQKGLQRLIALGLVECKSPEALRCKFYALTSKGRMYSSKISEWIQQEREILKKAGFEEKQWQ